MVQEGFIRLKASSRRRKEFVYARTPCYELQHRDWYDSRPLRNALCITRLCYHLLLGYRLKHYGNGAKEIVYVRGLVIEPTGGAANTYRRVGAFNHA
jgi:hypothetical protein